MTRLLPIAQQNDLRKIGMHRMIQRFIGCYARQTEVLAQGNKQGIIEGTSVFGGYFEGWSVQPMCWFDMHGRPKEFVQKLTGFL